MSQKIEEAKLGRESAVIKCSIEKSETEESVDDIVTLEIGNQTQRFNVNSLKRLSFFNAMFSKRWINDNTNKEKCIKIFGTNNNNTNSNDNSNDNFAFGLKDLNLLLKCQENAQIPFNLKPDCNILEGLIKCNDYLSSNIINEESLIEYFKKLKPRMNFKQRNELINNTNNNLLKNALNKLNNAINDKMDATRNEFALNHSKLVSLENITFDNKTANKLFIEKYKIKCEYLNNNYTKLKISISNFTSLDEYDKLWEQCDWDENLSVITQLPDLVNKVIKWENENNETSECSIESKYQLSAILTLLEATIEASVSNSIDLSILDCNILSLIKTYFILVHQNNGCSIDLKDIIRLALRMPLNNIVLFMNFIFEKMEKYFKNYNHILDHWSQNFQNRKTKARSNFLQAIKESLILLSKYDEELLVNKSQIWFPIFHENDENSTNWIMDDLVSNMNAQNASDFGIYLTKYIAYEMKEPQKFPQIYLVFLQQELGITWEIVPTTE